MAPKSVSKSRSASPKARSPARAGAKATPAVAKAKGGAAASKQAEEERKQKEAAEAAEAEARRKAEEEQVEEERKKAEAERIRAEEEAKAKAEAERLRKQEKENGEVVIKYSMYAEKFPIKGGKMLAAEIDELYCLSDIMPKCVIHLSLKSTEEKYAILSAGEIFPYIFEDPVGTFHELEAGETYFVHIDEDEAEFQKSLAKAKQAFAGVTSAATRGEGCSCIEGNPCGSECDAQGNTVCLDWHNRFAVAKAHGWIGYQAK